MTKENTFSKELQEQFKELKPIIDQAYIMATSNWEQDHSELWEAAVDLQDASDALSFIAVQLRHHSHTITPADWKPEGVK
jgi:hypothetical protein